MDTDHQPIGFISSQQTENSEQQQQAISLGKKLVQELSLEPGVDTLSRWIVHYIAEQIAIAESTEGAAKIAAEKRCFDSIMQLWQHRYALPNERSPFKDFVPIFETLQRINPENQKSIYIHWEYDSSNDPENAEESDLEKSRDWLRMALSVDKSARVLIESLLQLAAQQVTSEEVRAWLKFTPKSIKNSDVLAIEAMVGKFDDEDDIDDEEGGRETQESILEDQELPDPKTDDPEMRELAARLEYLEDFLGISTWLRDAFQEALESKKSQ